MWSLCATALISLVLVTSAATRSTRKSLRFGSLHPHACYVNKPRPVSLVADMDPFEVAHVFLRSHTQSDYYIRDDSYTDPETGITHIYVRQRFGDLEVADGNINLNIRGGHVLSYGDSFFKGSMPLFGIPPATSHTTYCAEFSDRTASFRSSAQLVFDDSAEAHNQLYAQTCTQPLAAVKAAATLDTHKDTHEPHDPRRAALYFMVAAHPESSVVEGLIHEFDAILDRMTVTYGEDSPRSAIISGLPGAIDSVSAKLVYVQTLTNGKYTTLHVTWRLEVEMDNNWYEAYVSANDPATIVSVVDWAADSHPHQSGHLNALEAKLASGRPIDNINAGTYKVWKFGINDPEASERTVESAYDILASPLGWHTISRANNPSGSPDWLGKDDLSYSAEPYLNFTTTWGNNVFAQENWKGKKEWKSNYRPNAGRGLQFEYDYTDDLVNNYNLPESPQDYIDLAVTQLFYTTNMVHDLYYRYGFKEVHGNFQQDNYNRGGKDNDAIIAHAQDGSGFSNANFMTASFPPDGKPGRCCMYIWDTSNPYRDGDFDAGILIHELTHGLANRLTGGPADSGCLGLGEGAGMSEGWGDFMATVIRSTENNPRNYVMGSWVSNSPYGLRYYPYSTNITLNPTLFSTLDRPGFWEFHATGEVWAEMLWVVFHHLVQEHGYSPTLFPPQPFPNGTTPIGNFYRPDEGKSLIPKHGNTLMIQLVISAMKLQPCRPTFLNARDAILEADYHLTGGKNNCTIWAGFSSRGLGLDASESHIPDWGTIHTDGFKVPDECR